METHDIQESQDMLSQMISGSPIPTFVIDKNHTVTHFNKACESLTGIFAQDIIGTDDQWKAFYAKKRPVMADIILDSSSHDGLEQFYKGKYRVSRVKPGAYEAEDFFPDLKPDGRWLFFTAAPVKNRAGEIIGAIETIQDITREKRVSELNAAMFRISQSLHRYSYLDDLLSYISQEIKTLLNAEGALVILHDQETGEVYFPGIAYDDPNYEQRVRAIRFSTNDVIAGQVIQNGKPLILNDVSSQYLYSERDRKLGYVTRSLVEVPIITEDRTIGVLSGINKKGGEFSERDVQILYTLAGTVALAIENTRFQEELRQAYREVRLLNTAKGKAINHLSHELKTPVSILSEAFSLLEDDLKQLPVEDWKPLSDMIYRQLKRINEIESEVSDIIKDEDRKTSGMTPWLIEQCGDLLSVLAANSIGKGDVINRIKAFINKMFFSKEPAMAFIDPIPFIRSRITIHEKGFIHRNVDVYVTGDERKTIHIPEDIFGKIIDGLIRNAIENTPDEGNVDISVWEKAEGIYISVKDSGVGIREDYQGRVFEGFFPTQDMTAYSTRQPFDFNAGGKGADLLRMKIFSEVYDFSMEMHSTRCPHLDSDTVQCPGRVSRCPFVSESTPCDRMGGTEFVLRFRSVR